MRRRIWFLTNTRLTARTQTPITQQNSCSVSVVKSCSSDRNMICVLAAAEREMTMCRTVQSLLMAVVVCLALNYSVHSQSGRPRVRIKMDTPHYDQSEGWKEYLASCNFYTIVDGRKYLIEWLIRGLVSIPELILDSVNNHVAYASNIGCGAPHDEGMVVTISDVYGKKKRPILGSCNYLRPVRFIDYLDRTYLLISETTEGDWSSFWLYDVNGGEFVLHAYGLVKELKDGTFAY